MNYLSVDEIAEQINETAREIDGGTLRRRTIAFVRKVYTKLDNTAVLVPGIESFVVPATGAVAKPANFHRLIDIGNGSVGLREVSEMGQFPSRGPSYRTGPGYFQFENDMRGQKITITYWQIPTGPQGEILVDDRIERLVVLFGQSEYERLKLSGSDTQNVSRVAREYYKREYEEELWDVQSHLNQATRPQWRTLMSELRTELWTVYDHQ